MKRILLILTTVTFIASCNNGPSRKELSESNDSLKIALAQKEESINDLLSAMSIVEDGFKKINEIQGRINLSGINEVNYKENIKENIEYITTTLANNKTEIEKLKKQLANGKQATKEIKEKMRMLEQQLSDKSKEIAQIYKTLAEKNIYINKLDSIISDLTRANTGQELQLIAQEQELNSVWYAIGTKSELKGENILKSGEVMRESNINLKYFTKADKRELKEIDTRAKRAKLLTNHPDGSYTLERNEEKYYILTITNPEQFWSSTRYLVIQVR